MKNIRRRETSMVISCKNRVGSRIPSTLRDHDHGRGIYEQLNYVPSPRPLHAQIYLHIILHRHTRLCCINPSGRREILFPPQFRRIPPNHSSHNNITSCCGRFQKELFVKVHSDLCTFDHDIHILYIYKYKEKKS